MEIFVILDLMYKGKINMENKKLLLQKKKQLLTYSLVAGLGLSTVGVLGLSILTGCESDFS